MENTERERIANKVLEFGRKEYARLDKEPMGEAHWAYLEGIKATLNRIKREHK